MKKRAIGLLVVVVVATACRYHCVFAVDRREGPAICKKTGNKIECNAEAAMIQEVYQKCLKACPNRVRWHEYCSDNRFECESDCELLRAEKKSTAEIKACKEACSKEEARCKASYRNKQQCKNRCRENYQKDMSRFDKRWIKKIFRR